jgi:hypothetical protein
MGGLPSLQELALPGCDLRGMHIMLLRQLCQALLAPYCFQRHARFERGTMVPSRSSHALLSSSWAISSPYRAGQSLPLSTCPKKQIHLSLLDLYVSLGNSESIKDADSEVDRYATILIDRYLTIMDRYMQGRDYPVSEAGYPKEYIDSLEL